MARVPVLQLGTKPARRERRRPVAPAPVLETSDVEPGHLIQGHKASGPEWAVYKVLRSLGYDDEVQFQVSVFGGQRFPGGQILDFVIAAGPQTVVVDVRGLRYHGTQAGKAPRDRFREMQLAAMPDPPRVVVVWEDIAVSADRLRALLLRELGAKR